MPFVVPWTDDIGQSRVCRGLRRLSPRARATAGGRDQWSLELGVWAADELLGAAERSSAREFTATGEPCYRLVARAAFQGRGLRHGDACRVLELAFHGLGRSIAASPRARRCPGLAASQRELGYVRGRRGTDTGPWRASTGPSLRLTARPLDRPASGSRCGSAALKPASRYLG